MTWDNPIYAHSDAPGVRPYGWHMIINGLDVKRIADPFCRLVGKPGYFVKKTKGIDKKELE